MCSSFSVDKENKIGLTPLYYACRHGSVDVVRFLVNRFVVLLVVVY